MAERFGGKYSPENSRPAGEAPPPNPFQGQRRSLAGGRVNALFIVPLIFAVSAFRQPPIGLAIDLGACGLLLLAAWLTREGLLAEEAYAARTVARRPALPRKIFGAVLTGAGLALGGYHAGGGLLAPAIFAVLGAGLHLAAFGPDPLSDKGLAGIDPAETDRVAAAVQGAEAYLTAMQDAIRRASDRGLSDHVDRFIATARAMFRQIEADPRDLTAARRYLGVYLMGARDATIGFADLYAQHRDPAARDKYEALLTDLEANFATQSQALLANDKTNLDIQIDVLRERLQQEGVRPS
ncbi:MAG: hypothetical protein GC186_06880 [Rhodobacteraceae bacterium]|nr:hypothetical protein [Paracoccaceae bacterium]